MYLVKHALKKIKLLTIVFKLTQRKLWKKPQFIQSLFFGIHDVNQFILKIYRNSDFTVSFALNEYIGVPQLYEQKE